jgi:hypothetical protein
MAKVSFLSSAFPMPSRLTVAISASVMRRLNDNAIAKAVGFKVEGVRFRVDLKFG